MISFFSFLGFIFTFIKSKFTESILFSFYEENKISFIASLIFLGLLLISCAVFFIIANTLEIPFYKHLLPFAAFGFLLFWEVLILFSFTRVEMRNKPKYWVGLPLLLASNYFLWHTLVNAGRYLQPNLPNVYPDETIRVFSTYKWWQLLLPIKEFQGSWPFGLVLTYLIENIIGTAGVWYLYQAILMLTAFFLSWKVFRSEIMGYFLAICLGFGTHHYHAFQYSGITGFYLFHTLFLLLLYFSFEFIRREKKNIGYLIALIPTLLLAAIYYEGWLDFFASTWVITIFLVVYFKRKQQEQYLKKLLIVFGIFNLVAAIYIYMKFTYIGFSHATGESAVVVFYGREYFWRGVEDLISNYFTHLYMTLTNFLPPAFITSNSLYQYTDKLESGNFLTYGHYIFYWRYFAGAAAVLFFLSFSRAIKKVFNEKPFSAIFPLIIFMSMVAVNGATHTIIQFRPMKAMPVLGYYIQQGVLGFSLCIAYAFHLFNIKTKNKKIVALVSILAVSIILWSSIRRPNYLWHMIEVGGIDHQGPYPNPLNVLIITIRRLFPGFLL